MRSMLHCRFRRAVMACFKHSRSSSSSLHSCNCCDTINTGWSGWSDSQKSRKPGKHPYAVLSTGLGEDRDSEPRTELILKAHSKLHAQLKNICEISGEVSGYSAGESRGEVPKITCYPEPRGIVRCHFFCYLFSNALFHNTFY